MTDQDDTSATFGSATEADLPAAVQSPIACRGADTAGAQTLIAGDLQVRWDLLADAANP